MADHTHIEWTDATWNVVTGCSIVSPGCTNCYAMKLAGTRLKHHPSRAGLTVDSKAGPVWNGQVRFNAEWLTQPLRWTRPRRIFVAAHGDLFHEGVTDDQLDRIFAVMALCPRHTFQVLTKRPERMREYLANPARARRIKDAAFDAASEREVSRALRAVHAGNPFWSPGIPLPNVWLGVSVEDQARATERIGCLLVTPAAVRWLSAEPLLGPVDLRRVRFSPSCNSGVDALKPASWPFQSPLKGLDWVVAGGESGPGARPMHPAWARQLRDQCAAAGVPFLFKQWGDWAPEPVPPRSARGMHCWAYPPVGQGPGGTVYLVGKKTAGRLLDGQLHDAYPEVRHV